MSASSGNGEHRQGCEVAQQGDQDEPGDRVGAEGGSHREDHSGTGRVLPHVVAHRESTGHQQVGPLGVQLDVVDDQWTVGVGDVSGEGANQQQSRDDPG